MEQSFQAYICKAVWLRKNANDTHECADPEPQTLAPALFDFNFDDKQHDVNADTSKHQLNYAANAPNSLMYAVPYTQHGLRRDDQVRGIVTGKLTQIDRARRLSTSYAANNPNSLMYATPFTRRRTLAGKAIGMGILTRIGAYSTVGTPTAHRPLRPRRKNLPASDTPVAMPTTEWPLTSRLDALCRDYKQERSPRDHARDKATNSRLTSAAIANTTTVSEDDDTRQRDTMIKDAGGGLLGRLRLPYQAGASRGNGKETKTSRWWRRREGVDEGWQRESQRGIGVDDDQTRRRSISARPILPFSMLPVDHNPPFPPPLPATHAVLRGMNHQQRTTPLLEHHQERGGKAGKQTSATDRSIRPAAANTPPTSSTNPFRHPITPNAYPSPQINTTKGKCYRLKGKPEKMSKTTRTETSLEG
ncbi:hypothetical protein CCMSSC00406_0009559 [Pleurotus cornucopiae]|uniref:Uncharacterized protein n=1 Tax=Pleurotus cornucopiae TaxID=5321 RepID=A0ACB7IPS9_PLECO|nr:hypothetical protein CCMSSC00406_0009559 [Pleurotus cornucopiae]